MTARNPRRVRRITLALVAPLLALVGLLAAPATAQTDTDLEIERIDAGGFPTLRAVVSGPSIAGVLDDQFVLVEDGQERTTDVVRLGGDELSVVVVVDQSVSMAGEPIEQAKSAVRALTSSLPSGAEVAVVGFASTAKVLLPMTSDLDSVDRVADGLIADGRTALYDGITLSLDLLGDIDGSRAVVVLSDGKDTESLSTLESVSERLGTSDVLLSIVTLESADYDGAVADLLAQAAGGSVVPVTAAGELASAFSEVAAGLSNLYELRWTSASTGSSAELTISLASAPDNAVTATFRHEERAEFVPDIATDTVTVSGGNALLSASWVPLVGALAVSLGALGLLIAFRNSAAATERRERRASDRVFERQQRKTMVSGVADRLNDISSSVIESSGKGRSLDASLERAGLSVSSGELVTFVLCVSVASAALGGLIFGMPFGLVLIALPVVLTPLALKILTSRRRSQFVEQLGDTLQLMAGSLTAGYGLGQTLDSVARETESPTSDEFARVVMETRLGRSLEDALDAMSHRLQAPDFDWVVDAIKIQSSVGGNLSEIITQVGETIRARNRIRRQVQALTAEGKISALVLFVLPIGLTGFISMSNPAYVAPMFETTTGWMLLGGAGFLMTGGGLWLKKLVSPEF